MDIKHNSTLVISRILQVPSTSMSAVLKYHTEMFLETVHGAKACKREADTDIS